MVRVIYVGGAGRSGSTLLDRVIGQIPGFVSAGEVRTIWWAGARENRLCGCGQAFADCGFWQRVGDEAFGGWSKVDADGMDASLASMTYVTSARRLMSRTPAPQVDGEAARSIERLYAAISGASNGAIVVDSSKGPRYGVLLGDLPTVDLHAIHLVRDSRGVAYSWSKDVMRPDTPGRSVPMNRIGAAGASARWIVQNAFMELMARQVPVSRLRYESFIDDPTGELVRVLNELGMTVDPSGWSFLTRDSVRLGPNHTVMGNPMRMKVGDVPLRADLEWQRRLPRWQRLLVTAMTLPLLVRYGYRVDRQR